MLNTQVLILQYTKDHFDSSQSADQQIWRQIDAKPEVALPTTLTLTIWPNQKFTLFKHKIEAQNNTLRC